MPELGGGGRGNLGNARKKSISYVRSSLKQYNYVPGCLQNGRMTHAKSVFIHFRGDNPLCTPGVATFFVIIDTYFDRHETNDEFNVFNAVFGC